MKLKQKEELSHVAKKLEMLDSDSLNIVSAAIHCMLAKQNFDKQKAS